MKPLHDCIEASLTSWSDPGCYPSGAGGGALPDGPLVPEDISGFIILEVTPQERDQLEAENKVWQADKGNLDLEDVGGLFSEIVGDIIVPPSEAKVTLRDVAIRQIGTSFILVVPTHWLIEGQDDIGGPEYKIDAEVSQAVKWLQSHGLVPKEL